MYAFTWVHPAKCEVQLGYAGMPHCLTRKSGIWAGARRQAQRGFIRPRNRIKCECDDWWEIHTTSRTQHLLKVVPAQLQGIWSNLLYILYILQDNYPCSSCALAPPISYVVVISSRILC